MNRMILTGAKEWHTEYTDAADEYGFFFTEFPGRCLQERVRSAFETQSQFSLRTVFRQGTVLFGDIT